MDTKQQVISGIIGGIVGSIITAFVVPSGTALRDKFDMIQCRRLEVVDAAGEVQVVLSVSENGGYVGAGSKNGNVWASLGAGKHGGIIAAMDESGHIRALH